MPSKTTLYIPDHVAYTKIWGVFTAAEMTATNQEVIAILDQAPQPMQLIVDFREMTDFPKKLTYLSSTFTVFSHPKHDWQFVLSSDRVINFVSQLTFQVVAPSHRKNRMLVTSNPQEILDVLVKFLPRDTVFPPFPPEVASQN
ncbi:MAG: hypothetical protein MUF87_16585 [Anaerolineae bacterium]|nr:hypothetical protein [Anaerolineae bacterium]